MFISAGMVSSNDFNYTNQCAILKVGLKSNESDSKQMAEATVVSVPFSALAGQCPSLWSPRVLQENLFSCLTRLDTYR